MSSYWRWRPYVPVAARKAEAEKRLAKLKKKGEILQPITIAGRQIASSFWGRAWCDNLERYSDYASRLGRGRSYVRNGSVVDLRIEKGEINAKVSGQDLYSVRITIAPVAKPHWQAICKDCAGGIDSLVELLQGRLAETVMDRVCRQGDGLFPAPKEIKLSCDCPDWATMCKHVAATLYGVGARLDHQPELIFLLRGVNENDLISRASETLGQQISVSESSNILQGGDLGALFGLDMAENTAAAAAGAAKRGKKMPQSAAGAPGTAASGRRGRDPAPTKKNVVSAKETSLPGRGNKSVRAASSRPASSGTAKSGAGSSRAGSSGKGSSRTGKAAPGTMHAKAKKAVPEKRATERAAPRKRRGSA